jgi:mRNA-degrading endonuclease toxin of MazEF toxin-antitoxin module
MWKVDIPFAPGHMQAGERPAVIVQDDRFIVTLPTVLIVPFTGSRGATRFPGTVPVQPDG